MKFTIDFIDVDVELGVRIFPDDPGRDNRIIFRIDLANAKVRDKAAAVESFTMASRADRSTMARLYGRELAAGEV
jgi:hypothetical protein